MADPTAVNTQITDAVQTKDETPGASVAAAADAAGVAMAEVEAAKFRQHRDNPQQNPAEIHKP